jgi:hypothetical protein
MKALNKDMTINDEPKVINCQGIHVEVCGCKLKRPDIRVQCDPLKVPGEGPLLFAIAGGLVPGRGLVTRYSLLTLKIVALTADPRANFELVFSKRLNFAQQT